MPDSPISAGDPILKSFVSYSIELADFPNFAGNRANPNSFSRQLLDNIGELQGTRPVVRIGEKTQ